MSGLLTLHFMNWKQTNRYWIDYEPKNFPGHYGMQRRVEIEPLKKESDRVNALSPQQAMEEYRARKNRPKSVPAGNSSAVESIIKSMDNRGAWVEEISIPDYKDTVNNPRRTLQGMNTATYIRNMRTMIKFIQGTFDLNH